MNYEVNITPQASNDLRGIYEYIAFTLRSSQNAAGQLDRLEKNIEALEQMPERYRVYDKEPWRSRNLRVLSVDNYLVFYIPNREDGVVTILRVMYAGRNIDKHLADSLI